MGILFGIAEGNFKLPWDEDQEANQCDDVEDGDEGPAEETDATATDEDTSDTVSAPAGY